MLNREVILEYQAMILEYLDTLVEPVDIGITAALILLTKTQMHSLESDIRIEDPALELALVIDKKNHAIPLPILQIILELSLYLDRNVVESSIWQISSLQQALQLILQYSQELELSNKKHVFEVFTAIDRACQWSDAELASTDELC